MTKETVNQANHEQTISQKLQHALVKARADFPKMKTEAENFHRQIKRMEEELQK